MTPSQRLSFENGRGERRTGRLERPAGEPAAYALLAHGLAGSSAASLSRALTRAGLAVLCLDLAAEGAPWDAGEVVAAADALAQRHEPPQLLVGHSLGGAAVLQAAARVPSARAVATLGAPSEPGQLLNGPVGGAEVVVAGRRARVGEEFLDALEPGRMRETVGALRRALLVLHAPEDEVVGIRAAADLFGAAKHPRSFLALGGADHLLSDEADATYAGRVIAAWAERYLEPQGAPEWWADAQDNRVAVRTEEGFRTEVRANGHLLVADEPTSLGGTDLGPTPYDYLGVALASCTSMTLRMYADRKGWPLEAAEVRVRHGKAHAEDCEACEKGAKLDHFGREIRLTGPLDGGQRARLLEIADRCPVHKTLEAEVRVTTKLKE